MYLVHGTQFLHTWCPGKYAQPRLRGRGRGRGHMTHTTMGERRTYECRICGKVQREMVTTQLASLTVLLRILQKLYWQESNSKDRRLVLPRSVFLLKQPYSFSQRKKILEVVLLKSVWPNRCRVQTTCPILLLYVFFNFKICLLILSGL